MPSATTVSPTKAKMDKEAVVHVLAMLDEFPGLLDPKADFATNTDDAIDLATWIQCSLREARTVVKFHNGLKGLASCLAP